jgi:hypothetical protein
VDSFHEAPPFSLLTQSAEPAANTSSHGNLRDALETRLAARTLNFTVCYPKARAKRAQNGRS